VCDAAGAALIVNDRLDVALAAGADGVHLGQDDLPIEAARRIAGGLWIGVSTHDVAQVRAACAAGADYLGFGPVFATTTKANPDPVAGLAGLAAACAAAGGVPVVAIGGVTAAAAPAIYRAGARAICAISAVNRAADVAGEVRRFRP
jgi:thiamine-phosphate pyrophosphorylase